MANTTWNIYNFRLNILEKLIKENFEIVVIAPVDEYIHYKEEYPSVTHIPLKSLHRDSVNPLRDMLLTVELIRKYSRIKPDILLHYTVKPNIYGGIAARYCGIPSIAVVTGLGYAFIHNGIIKKITKALYKISSGFHKKFIFENIDDRELFIKHRLIRKNQGISVKGCGVDAQYFVPQPNGKVKDKTVFTFLGRLLYDKGVSEFVRAAHKVKSVNPKAEFWVVGEIDKHNPAAIREEDLISWVKDKTIIYHGSTHDVKKYIAASDCIVLPSYREAIARSITEGMSMEKPVITTNTAGCREAVEEGKNGFLVPVKDSESLANAMVSFLKLPSEDRHKMGIYGRKKVLQEFDDRIIAEDIYQIIDGVLND